MLAVDGSAMGEKAVDFAFAEASLRGADLVAVHAWMPDYAPPGSGTETAERLLAQALAGRAEEYPDVTVGHEVLSATSAKYSSRRAEPRS